MKIFGEIEFSNYMGGLLNSMRGKINSESADYLLNIDEDNYIEHLVSEYSIDPIVIKFDDIYVSTHEKNIPAEYFPREFHVYEGKNYPKQIITYHVPYEGDRNLLGCIPNPRTLWTQDVNCVDNCIVFDFVDFHNNAEIIKQQADRIIDNIKSQYKHLQDNINSYNQVLKDRAREFIKIRKDVLIKQIDVVVKLGVPVRKATDVPKTFSVPQIRKAIIPKPVTSSKPAKPDPTLSEEIYQEILQTIYDMGKVFERLPATYHNKNEETLRDYLILQLEPRFQYSTTGETFNKSGKTDILIRHEKNNIFVAECKFWAGPKKHIETISQILSYLTWRDSKTAIIYFVKQKEIMQVIQKTKETTAQHENYNKLIEEKNNSWLIYQFHFPGEKDCLLKLTILLFHIPDPISRFSQ